MSEYIIFHNPRCSKSRATFELLTANGIEPEVFEYLEEPMNKEGLEYLFQALGKKPKDVLRVKEDEYKELTLDLNNDHEVIAAIITHPKILERPIVMKGDKAIIGRPPENVFELF